MQTPQLTMGWVLEQDALQISGSRFACPSHGARFDADGRWTGGQPTSNLRQYPTQYDAGAGTVTISSP